jgi:hypothetical protein
MPPKQPEVKIEVFANDYAGNVQATKEALDKMPKRKIFLEARSGEADEETVQINGHITVVPRGKEVEVPEEVANILFAKMRAENKMAQTSSAQVANLEKL